MTESTATLERPGEDAPSHADNPHHARRWLILVVIGLAQLMVVLDATVVNIALPSAQADLGFSDDARQWVVTAYALAFGSLLLLGGRLADLFGRKNALLVGLAGFAAVSAIGGFAGNIEMLLIARAAQGVFGALLAPPRFPCSPPRSPTRRSAAARSACSARSAAGVPPSACCSAACSPSTWTGAGACS